MAPISRLRHNYLNVAFTLTMPISSRHFRFIARCLMLVALLQYGVSNIGVVALSETVSYAHSDMALSDSLSGETPGDVLTSMHHDSHHEHDDELHAANHIHHQGHCHSYSVHFTLSFYDAIWPAARTMPSLIYYAFHFTSAFITPIHRPPIV